MATVRSVLILGFRILEILIFARIIMSWIQINNPTWWRVQRFVFDATEPMLAPIRRLLPPMGGLDLSPLVLFFGLELLMTLVLSAIT